MFKWYIDDAKNGEVDTFDEACNILESYGLHCTDQYSCDGNTVYFTESGDLSPDDDGAYVASITDLNNKMFS